MQVQSHKCEARPCTLLLLCPAPALSTEGPSLAEGCFSLLRGAAKEHCWSPGLTSLAAPWAGAERGVWIWAVAHTKSSGFSGHLPRPQFLLFKIIVSTSRTLVWLK